MATARFSMTSEEIWKMKYDGCRDMLQQLKQNINDLKSNIRPVLSPTEKDELQTRANEITILIAHSSVDVINLNQFTDAKLNLTIEEANRTDLLDSIQETLVDKDADKKSAQVQLSKEFKELANEFKKVQKRLSSVLISDEVPTVDEKKEEVGEKIEVKQQEQPKQIEQTEKQNERVVRPVDIVQIDIPPSYQQQNEKKESTGNDTFWQKKSADDGKDYYKRMLLNKYTLFAAFLLTIGIIAVAVSSNTGSIRRK